MVITKLLKISLIFFKNRGNINKKNSVFDILFQKFELKGNSIEKVRKW